MFLWVYEFPGGLTVSMHAKVYVVHREQSYVLNVCMEILKNKKVRRKSVEGLAHTISSVFTQFCPPRILACDMPCSLTWHGISMLSTGLLFSLGSPVAWFSSVSLMPRTPTVHVRGWSWRRTSVRSWVDTVSRGSLTSNACAGDDTHTSVGYSTALPTQLETRKRKRVETLAPSSIWQMLHSAQGRLLDKIDRAQS